MGCCAQPRPIRNNRRVQSECAAIVPQSQSEAPMELQSKYQESTMERVGQEQQPMIKKKTNQLIACEERQQIIQNKDELVAVDDQFFQDKKQIIQEVEKANSDQDY